MRTKKSDRVIFVCVGTPTPDRQGFGSSALIETDGVRLLVDCGPAAVWKLAKMGYIPTDINILFLTHLHFDHCCDLPCYLLSYWDQNTIEGKKALMVGPTELKAMTEKLIGINGAFSKDIDARMNAVISTTTYANRGGSLPRKWPVVDVVSSEEIHEYQYAHVLVNIMETEHVRPYLKSFAYRFNFKEKSIVFTGDTGSVSAIVDLAQACDLLVVNCWNARADIRDEQNPEALARIEEAAEMAAGAQARGLCLNHMGFRSGQEGMVEAAEIKQKVAQRYGGQLYLACEGMIIDV